MVRFFSLFLALVMIQFLSHAAEYDEELAESLKIEANHNLIRLKSYKIEEKNNKIFNTEREKGLAEYLEEQERYDLLRERGLQEYKKEKKVITPAEGGPEHRQYLKETRVAIKEYDESRKVFIKTRNKFQAKQTPELMQLELDELSLSEDRPRYSQAKRSRNKWLANGFKGVSGASGRASSPTFQTNVPQATDFQPAQEFPAASPAYEGFDEIPPPPPLYDTSGGVPYDPSYESGGIPQIPPPPPPPPDYDF